jgi:hypothetical protein
MIYDSSVVIVMGCAVTGRFFIPGMGKGFFFTPHRPDWPWCPPSLLSNGCRGKATRGAKLITHLQPTVQVKDGGDVCIYIYTSISPQVFMVWCLINGTYGQLYLFYLNIEVNWMSSPWKITITHLVQKFLYFLEHEYSLPRSQEPATGLYPEQMQGPV